MCQERDGGSIDAHPFTAADGTRYLYLKNDGNRIGVDTWISVQRLDASGTKLEGRPRRLFQQDQPWEGDLVEGPFVWESEGRFVMFYSANAYASAEYAVGVATADRPTGPFVKEPEPILVSNDVGRRAGPLRVVRQGRQGVDGLPRVGAGRDRLGRPRPHHVAQRGHLRRGRIGDGGPADDRISDPPLITAVEGGPMPAGGVVLRCKHERRRRPVRLHLDDRAERAT